MYLTSPMFNSLAKSNRTFYLPGRKYFLIFARNVPNFFLKCKRINSLRSHVNLFFVVFLKDQRGWWFSRESGYFKSDDASDCDKGFSESLDLITKTFELHGPFDGILGFSQGAALAALLCLMKTREPDAVPAAIQFQFAVLVAGFKSLSSKHAPWYAADGAKVKMPTLHVIGTEDRVIRKSVSEALLHHFQDPDKLYHSGGHYMVATAKQKRLLLPVLEQGPRAVPSPGPKGHDSGKETRR